MGQEDTTDTAQPLDPASPGTESRGDAPQGRSASRRRASRAAGPATDDVPPAPATITIEQSLPAKPKATQPRAGTRSGPPPRRPASWGKVLLLAAPVVAFVVVVLTATTIVLGIQHSRAEAVAAREQKFVDTASQTVVNMFSYTQNTIDESVDRFVAGISGPLRDMMAQGNNVDNLKAIFRDTQATSEAVISGAALEKVDPIAKNASVLVAVRVTVTDLDGVNAPSKPYRLRVIVHEDDDGRMTGYDLKYPDGGN